MERVQVVARIKPGGDGIFAPPEPLPDTEGGFKLTLKAAESSEGDIGTQSRQSDGVFEVDDVLTGTMSQQEVWEHFEAQIMERVLDPRTGHAHFGVTVMAYGQTGSGKTYTMMGPEECKRNPLGPDGDIVADAGICLRLCHSLFKQIERNQEEKQVKTTVTVGLLELYDAKMYDLLNKRTQLKLGQNRAGYFAMNQEMRTTTSLREVAAVLVEGYGNVTMGATAMNERSSRGHTIITIKVSTQIEVASAPGKKLVDKVASVQVVDLAGSERAAATSGPAKTGGVDRKGTLKEGTAINKALFNLGMMVEAASKPPPAQSNGQDLSEAQKAEKVALGIRLRAQDTLTRLLLDSIGGNVAAFLILAVRDQRQFFSEIKRSLEFGQKCRKVMNRPKEAMDAANLHAQLAKMQLERDMIQKERDDLAQKLSEAGVSAEIMGRLGPLLDRMSRFEDALFDNAENAEDSTEKRLRIMEDWLADTEYRTRLASYKTIAHAFREFESRSLAQRLRSRVQDPAVRMPAVPLLLCVNPSEAGIVCVTCHPGTSFGLDGTGDLIFGSAVYVDRIREMTKKGRYLDAEIAIKRAEIVGMVEELGVTDVDEDHLASSSLNDVQKPSLTKSEQDDTNRKVEEELAKLRTEMEALQQARKDTADGLRDLKERFGKFQVDSFVPLQGANIADEHCRLSVSEISAATGASSVTTAEEDNKTIMPWQPQRADGRKRARKYVMSITCMSPTVICRNGQVLQLGGGGGEDHPQLFRGISCLDAAPEDLVHGDIIIIGEAVFVYLQPDVTKSNLAWSDMLLGMQSQQIRMHASAVKLQRWFRCCDRNRVRPILLTREDQEIETDNVYVMYHGTPSLENAALIEQNGFRPSAGGLLGPGVYVSRDVRKAEKYRGTGVILEVLVRVGKVCHLKPGQVPVPVGSKWKELKAADPNAKQEMKEAKDLVATGWTRRSPWHEAGYDTAWVPADCSPQIFEGAHFNSGIKEETCVFDASRLTVLRRSVWDTDRAEVRRVQWLFQEDEDRLHVHGEDRFGVWVPYSRRLSVLIESHHLIYTEDAKRGMPRFVLTLESGHKRFNLHTGLQYEIDLERSTQKNVMTGYQRKLLRRDPLTEAAKEANNAGASGATSSSNAASFSPMKEDAISGSTSATREEPTADAIVAKRGSDVSRTAPAPKVGNGSSSSCCTAM